MMMHSTMQQSKQTIYPSRGPVGTHMKSMKASAAREAADPKTDKVYLYITTLLTAKIQVHITEVGNTIKQNLEEALNERVANKCIEEGFICPKTIKIHTYSAGTVHNEHVDFHVVYECQVANPTETQVLECAVKTITKAGIHAQCIDSFGNIPVTVFVARDHHHHSQEFQHVKDGDNIRVSVIGTRYELNDPYICVIAKLL
jgi:DNA-directed RNA polymerase subunit E'/Rpb7